jgi:hydrogenase expression/formation protein HypE
MDDSPLPVGKLPSDLLARLLSRSAPTDDRVLIGPGIGFDCAVLDFGDRLLVLKSDPITFATEDIGWYAVQVNANDIATTGALPRWLMAALLLPEGKTTPQLVEGIVDQVHKACAEINVAVIGGHTEITYGLDRPLLIGAMIGEVERDKLITPLGASPGDRILLTKGVPIEATAICAREFAGRLQDELDASESEAARDFLFNPGISILKDAQVAVQAGGVTAMHDPTEGGLAGALWELADASSRALHVYIGNVPIPELSRRICQRLGLDPLTSIASGALLMTASANRAPAIQQALEREGITCADIGYVSAGPSGVWIEGEDHRHLARPMRDDLARLFD